jgi:hypothetical protein
MMGLEPHSKIIVNYSLTTLIIIVDHYWLDLALSSSMFDCDVFPSSLIESNVGLSETSKE